MVKTRGPLGSGQAAGTFAKQLLFQTYGGQTILRKRGGPTTQPTAAQLASRAALSFLNKAWAALTPENHDAWEQLADHAQHRPFHAFLSDNLNRIKADQPPRATPTATPPDPYTAEIILTVAAGRRHVTATMRRPDTAGKAQVRTDPTPRVAIDVGAYFTAPDPNCQGEYIQVKSPNTYGAYANVTVGEWRLYLHDATGNWTISNDLFNPDAANYWSGGSLLDQVFAPFGAYAGMPQTSPQQHDHYSPTDTDHTGTYDQIADVNDHTAYRSRHQTPLYLFYDAADASYRIHESTTPPARDAGWVAWQNLIGKYTPRGANTSYLEVTAATTGTPSTAAPALALYRDTAPITTPTRNQLIAILLTDNNGDADYVDDVPHPATYCYAALPFSLDGRAGPLVTADAVTVQD